MLGRELLVVQSPEREWSRWRELDTLYWWPWMWRRAFDRVLCSGLRPCRIFVRGYVGVGGPDRRRETAVDLGERIRNRCLDGILSMDILAEWRIALSKQCRTFGTLLATSFAFEVYFLTTIRRVPPGSAQGSRFRRRR